MTSDKVELDFRVGSHAFYRESGAIVVARILRDNSVDGVMEKYDLELTHVLVPGVCFEENNIGDKWNYSRAVRGGGGVSCGDMFPLDDVFVTNSLRARGIDWNSKRRELGL